MFRKKSLTILTKKSNKSKSSKSSKSSTSIEPFKYSNPSISLTSSKNSIIKSLNLRDYRYRSLLDKYIDLIIYEKSRDNVSKKVIKRMKSTFLNIYNKLTHPTNYITTYQRERQYKYLSSREKNIKLLNGREKVFTTRLYSSKDLTKYTTGINYKDKPNTFLKVYETMDISSINEFYGIAMKIISEIYFNRRAYDVRNKCGFILPKILKFGIIKDEDRDNIVQIYLEMEYVDIKKFNSITSIPDNKILIEFFQKLYKINKCLEINNIYHNDIHEENVYYSFSSNNTIGDILLIDYGESLASTLR